ncbi:hypothetical protein [Hymenobacter metallilatus]|uniref:DUF4369 domain-containing protein n=1 Tax=Hymenobacter metallilatus TaxID=2493666 RepID=A0A428JFH0_9BACT|nr:hypothetical protein [Hymenobacter metallilatus]RSK31131.1 hypothetical protein EI290_14010 [Hymenobacter metallilatus]
MRALLLPLLLSLTASVPPNVPAVGTLFKGKVLNGMKGDSLSFVLAPDGKTVSNVTFTGYWPCDGKLEQQRAAGPAKGTFAVSGGTISGRLCEPPNGGATAWCFSLSG